MPPRTISTNAPSAASTALRRSLTAIARSERGPRVAALFDFDGTLIDGYSVFAFLREKLLQGAMPAAEMAATMASLLQYAAGRVDFEQLVTRGARHARGLSEDSYRELGERLYERHLANRLYAEARALVGAHLERGHSVAIVSSATVYQVAPAARELGIAHVLCTRFAVRAGRFTGELAAPPCFGTGKRQAAESFADSRGAQLARSYFYTDSHDDLPLLERVGRPRPVNPDPGLQRLAEVRGWPVLRFESVVAPRPLDYLRGLAPFPTLAVSIAAGLPVLALSRSVRETANFVVGTFGDLASAIAGVELEVRGERNLWSARPCIFVFNHQSNADVFIVAKLVRRDVAGIAKKELRSIPLLGSLAEQGGLVFVDRERTRDAVRAMQPLVDALRRDGKSVCIAPEGTRSSSGQLGPFKKGAFHLAIQARVPVVPIVIHDSRAVQPKHELAMRPARVHIDVLEPIDTSRWRKVTLERHVAAVRRRFAECLARREAENAVTGRSGHGRRQPARGR